MLYDFANYGVFKFSVSTKIRNIKAVWGIQSSQSSTQIVKIVCTRFEGKTSMNYGGSEFNSSNPLRESFPRLKITKMH